ncbi:MAG: cobalamin biosynthesis protein CbiL [Candidatus Electrothrix aestuarii]|uniref:Cobalamin biosynthesis protein CbiL n=1 Tax=Candidatus Electrothrix aestuarii TaxID=3062594 RepID=A0AAU8LXT1_9BACT
MRNNILFSLTILSAILFLSPNTTLAHKVRVFAYGEGNAIVGETAFSGGRKPKNADIIVEDAASGKQLFSSRTDEQGLFRFTIPNEAQNKHLDLRIIVQAGDGHRGEWLLEAADYLSAAPETPIVPAATPAAGAETSIPLQQMQQVMQETIDRELAPVKRMLAQSSEHGPTLQDILGGIGYILGLAGIAAYFKAQQKNKGMLTEC